MEKHFAGISKYLRTPAEECAPCVHALPNYDNVDMLLVDLLQRQRIMALLLVLVVLVVVLMGVIYLFGLWGWFDPKYSKTIDVTA